MQTIFDTSEQALYQLNSEQELSIETSRDEIKNDKFRKNEIIWSNLAEIEFKTVLAFSTERNGNSNYSLKF